MTHKAEKIAEIAARVRALRPWELAQLADCASPDSEDSAGARMLASVAESVAESLEWDPEPYASGDVDPHEIADGAPSVYTATRWAEFVDLGAYSEDVSELVSDARSDLTDAAGVALYMIAERLVFALADGITDELETEDETDD